MRTGIHFANLATSPRLQRLLAILREYPGGLTTREIVHRANIMAVNSAVCELRKQGFAITCQMFGRTKQGSSVFLYRLTEATP